MSEASDWWGSSRGLRTKQSDDVWTADVTLTISTPGAAGRNADWVLDEVVRKMLAPERLSKHVRRVDVDVYPAEDDVDEPIRQT